VLAVIYLIYNEGYSGRVDLGAEAIRLGRVLAALMPDEPEAHGLLALMMIHHARRRARFCGEDLVLLEDQDRSLWDHPQIAAGRAVLGRAAALGGRGGYVIQAAIASLQAAERIDWPQVADLYRLLAGLTGSPVVELNGAVALAALTGWAAPDPAWCAARGRHGMHEGCHDPSAARAQRVAESDNASTHVQLGRIGACLALPGEHHAGECLVNLKPPGPASGAGRGWSPGRRPPGRCPLHPRVRRPCRRAQRSDPAKIATATGRVARSKITRAVAAGHQGAPASAAR